MFGLNAAARFGLDGESSAWLAVYFPGVRYFIRTLPYTRRGERKRAMRAIYYNNINNVRKNIGNLFSRLKRFT